MVLLYALLMGITSVDASGVYTNREFDGNFFSCDEIGGECPNCGKTHEIVERHTKVTDIIFGLKDTTYGRET